MKYIPVALVIFAAFMQCGLCFDKLSPKTHAALVACANKQNLDLEKVQKDFQVAVIDENDPKLIEFHICIAEELKFKNEILSEKHDNFLAFVTDVIKMRMGDVQDADTKAREIAVAAIDNCKDTNQDPNRGVYGIRLRNCIKAYASKPHT